ncbi:hypothetical protein [Streptomyces sp. SBT349]|uniref:hypothetical protein n=1 Tax=Streptomyces sp. SBT349 TaxID=1580539 RepID=UPI00066A5680|nr:hypothetical protein [Streptomyces sp. SBT349]
MATKADLGPRRVEVTAATVRVGDVLAIGDRHFVVLHATGLHGGAVRLKFVSGELLSIHRATRLAALRAEPPELRPSSFCASRQPSA